ncbi:MAG: NAD(P)-dependent oxidoreductase [Vicinamibacteria bacterium]|jgi:UDP-glucose 4-epimerase|nr:NAD(P)-dependent oxidoreductase [Vicinamibacteria bacterium]
MKIAVTGASGHLGQHVVAALAARGDDVLALGRHPLTGPTIPGVLWPRSVEWLAVDLSQPSAARALSDGLRDVSAVVHLSAFIPEDTARNADADADRTLATNVSGTAALVAALETLPRPLPVVYASTFEVYGSPRHAPIGEDHPLAPLGYYGASKLIGEEYLHLHGQTTGAACAALRLPAIYGPGDTLQRAIGNFVRAAAAGRDLEIHGDGEDRRELVYVRDAAEAIMRAIDAQARGPFNVASGRGYSIREMAEAAIRAAGSGQISVRARSKARLDYVLDITRARKELRWEPRTSLEAGMAAQIAWWRAIERSVTT